MLRRPIPSQRQLTTRKAILDSYCDLTPVDGDYYGLEKGNKKTGTVNQKGQTVMVWNLPPVITCPGAKDCKSYCYNADTRNDIYPIENWCRNLYWVKNREEELFTKLNEQIHSVSKPVIRIHSSGDFFSNEYINLWKKIIVDNATALFWGYTCSWRIPELYNSLDQLRQLPNIQLLASVDKNEVSPCGWRFCLVGEELHRADMYNCPEQYKNGLDCINCSVCFLDNNNNIYFTKH